MKLLTAYYGRQNRGCWKRLKRLLLHMAGCGHRIQLITSINSDTINHYNINHIVLSLRCGPEWLKHLYFLVACQIVCFFLALKHKHIRLLAFDGHNAFALLSTKLANRRAHLFLSVRGHPRMQRELNDESIIEQWLLRITDHIGHLHSDYVVYNSKETARQVERLYKITTHNVLLVPNDITSPLTKLHVNCREIVRQKFKIPAGALVLGYAGQFITRKNIVFILRAVADRSFNKQIYLILKGEGRNKRFLCEEVSRLGVSSIVHFLPWDDQMSEFYQAIDIFVLPSLYDDCSNALLDAMSHGTCVLASDSGGNREILALAPEFLFSINDDGLDLRTKIVELQVNHALLTQARRKVALVSRSFQFDWNNAMAALILNVESRSSYKIGHQSQP